MKTLSLWIFGLLLISPTGAHGLNHFPENFVVVKKHDTVTLTCSSAQLTGDVTWKLENDEIEVDDDFQLDGQNLKVSGVGTPSLGNYSCWSGEEMLSSTHLLLEAEAEEELDSFFHCWAKSYDCNFSCVWNNSRYTAVRLGLGHDCFEGEKSCDWVSSNNQLPNGGFQFELSHSLSPYAEESTMLKLAVEAMVYPLILRRTKRFYLRDIVQPDSPQIVKCQEVGEEMNVTINPPSSWSTPHSFFRLEHQIQYKLKDDGKVENSSSLLIPKRISKLRVRCRDSVVLSTWSQWTPWKNVIVISRKFKSKNRLGLVQLDQSQSQSQPGQMRTRTDEASWIRGDYRGKELVQMQKNSKILLSRVANWVLGPLQEEREEKEQKC